MVTGFRVGIYLTNPIITEGFRGIARQVADDSAEILVLSGLGDGDLQNIDVLLVDPYSSKQGFAVREIAGILNVSPRTINTVNAKMRNKYGVRNLALLEI